MNKRGLVKELLVSYLNTHKLHHVPIKDFVKEFKGRVPKGVDLYRNVYHIGLNDVGFRIEKDEESTYVVMG